MKLIPCPNNGVCGSRAHNPKSARYRECLAVARFSGRGKLVGGMIAPKTPGLNTGIPLSDIHSSSKRLKVRGVNTGTIEVWRDSGDHNIRARFFVNTDFSKPLEAAGFVSDAGNDDEVLDVLENAAETGLWRDVEDFYGMERCDLPYGLDDNYFVATRIIREDEADVTDDIIGIVAEVSTKANSGRLPEDFAAFIRERVSQTNE